MGYGEEADRIGGEALLLGLLTELARRRRCLYVGEPSNRENMPKRLAATALLLAWGFGAG